MYLQEIKQYTSGPENYILHIMREDIPHWLESENTDVFFF